MGKKCKKKIVWKQLNLGENSSPVQNTDGFSYSDAVSNCHQNGYESNWSNGHYLDNVEDRSHSNGGENGSYSNNRRQNYRPNRSNRNNAYKWRRRVDRPIEESEKENLNEDAGELIQDEEYTKIQTPRQEVIFKKRSLQRRKEVEYEGTQCNDIAFGERLYDTKMTEIMHSSISYDDTAMYMPEASNPTIAGVVVQQLYPGGPMVSIPVHYGQYVSPTLIPGDPTLLTLDPSYTRIISADEIEDAGTMLPMQLDSNGHPITVQVKVDMNGVPIEIEPRGFQVFEGHIEEQQYFICSESQQQSHMEECIYEQSEGTAPDREICGTPTDEERDTCGTPSDEDAPLCETPSDEEVEVVDIHPTNNHVESSNDPIDKVADPTTEFVAACDASTSAVEDCSTHATAEIDATGDGVVACDISTDQNPKLTNEIEIKHKEEEKDVKDSEECSSDSQYATMSESSSPNTPASELSDHSDIPDQTLQPKLVEQRCSSVKRDDNSIQKPVKIVKTPVSKQTAASNRTVISKPEEKFNSEISAPSKRRSAEKKKAKATKELELQTTMTRKQRKKEAKLLKKQTKTDLSPTTPPVIIREKASPNLLAFNSPNCSNQFATKSLRSSLAFLNSPEFSVQQYLKYQGSFQNRCKSSLINRIDSSNIMTSPLEGFGHIDLVDPSTISNDNVLQCQSNNESLPDTPKLKLPTKPNTLLMPEQALADLKESSLISSEQCTEKLSDNSNSELNVVQSQFEITDLNSTGTNETQDISDFPNEKTKGDLLPDKQNQDESMLVTQIEKLPKEPLELVTSEATKQTSSEIKDSDLETSVQITAEILMNDQESVSKDTCENGQASSQITTEIDNNRFSGDDVTTPYDNASSISDATVNKSNEKEDADSLDCEQLPDVDFCEVSENINPSSNSSPVVEEVDETYDAEKSNVQDINNEGITNELELISENQENDATFSKQGYVMVPVLTPYYSPTVFYGYPLVMQDVCEDQGKFNRKKKRRYKKKYHDNPQQFYEANQLTGNPYITTDDGFVIPVDPSQACHIHSCQYIHSSFAQQGVVDEGFASADATPYLPSYIPEPDVVMNAEGEVFGNLQTHERNEIAEVLKDAPKFDASAVESGDSGVSESEDYSKKAELQKEKGTNDKLKKQPHTAKVKGKKENKQNRKANAKGGKSSKHIMVIEEPDFSLPNSYPFGNKTSVPNLDKISVKTGKSKKNKKPKKGKNKKDNIFPPKCEEIQQGPDNIEICDVACETKDSPISNLKLSKVEDSNSVLTANYPETANDIIEKSQIELSSVATIESGLENVIDIEVTEGPAIESQACNNHTNGNIIVDNNYSTNLDNEDTSTFEDETRRKFQMKETDTISPNKGDHVEPLHNKETLSEIGKCVDAKYSATQNCEECLQNYINIGNGCADNKLHFVDLNDESNEKVLQRSIKFPECSFDQLRSVNEYTCQSLTDMNLVARGNNITYPLEIVSLAVLDESAHTLSTIEETNEECSEVQINASAANDCTESSISSNTGRSISKDRLSDTNDSPANSNHSIIYANICTPSDKIDITDSSLNIHRMTDKIEQPTTEIVIKELVGICNKFVKDDEAQAVVEVRNGTESDSLVANDDTLSDQHQTGDVETDADGEQNTNSLQCNFVDSDQIVDQLSPSDQYSGDDFKLNSQEVVKICQSLGVAKAVEKWMQEITPAKAFITCNNESQNMLLLDELKECERNLSIDNTNVIEKDSKNGESNPLVASRNSLNDSEGVAESPRELNDSIFSRRSTLTDLDWNETVPELNKYDPSMFSKYYYLGPNVDTPVSSRASSRDPSSNHSGMEVDPQSLSANEVDFQDNFYHSNKIDDSISSVPPSESVSRLYTQTSCSDMATSTKLQDRKGSCSKETECASLFSSGIGSSLDSTPLTSPSHLPPVPTEGGKTSFPHTKQTDPQCAIL